MSHRAGERGESCQGYERGEEKRRKEEKYDQKYFIKANLFFIELLEKPYWTDYKPFRLSVHNLVTSKYFDLAISAVIGLNVITMAMEYYMMPQYLDLSLTICNYGFTLIFLCEVGLKMYAMGLSRYFRDRQAE